MQAFRINGISLVEGSCHARCFELAQAMVMMILLLMMNIIVMMMARVMLILIVQNAKG